jgi:hypothetical protein
MCEAQMMLDCMPAPAMAVSAAHDAIDPFAMKPEDLERLVTQTMPYGKYKGRLIADLPGNYLNWFARVGFPPGDLGQLLALMQEIDHNGLSGLLQPLRRR